MRYPILKNLGITLLTSWMLFAVATVFAAPGFSEMNNVLFDSAHLDNIDQPGVLTYEYEKESVIDDSREDTIKVSVSNIRNTGRRDLAFEFFTGKHKRPYEAMENQRGNGVFVLFLEFDVHEMKRVTGGEWRYFQRKLRWSFAQGAQKKTVNIDYNGETVKGTQYIVRPYINDPKNKRYKLYAGKYYIFTLCESIPGEIYQVRTVVPDGDEWSEGEPTLVDESITFAGFNEGA